MKVFEVITEHGEEDSREIITTVQYVTSDRGTLLSITEFFTNHCYEYEKDLIGVKEVLVVTQHITEEESAQTIKRITLREKEEADEEA